MPRPLRCLLLLPVRRMQRAALPGTLLLHPAAQGHIREGALPLGEVLRTLTEAAPLQRGAKPAHLCIGQDCMRMAHAKCTSLACGEHCANPLCPRHDGHNTELLRRLSRGLGMEGARYCARGKMWVSY